ncbi:MAG: prepilin-type N-terminal cleavage/methylation domain-containing protein [Phycisphaerales bacterium]|nr:MAG: prepilin-type N-terminal cleavage/methylation domain-containing protein [Phycisphaerales bacterium]
MGASVRSRGMTLIELLVAMTITATVIGGLGSAIMITSRAAPQSGDPLKARLDTLHGADLLAAELAGAIEITEAEPRSIAFRVRRHNGITRTVRYHWSGVPGDPLLRTFASGEDVEVLAGVQRMAIGYERQQGSVAPRTLTHPEQIVSIITGTDDDRYTVDDQAAIAQPFDPDLPEGTVRARFTEARVMMRRNELLLPSGAVTVQVRRFNPDTNRPGRLIAWGEVGVSSISYSYEVVRVPLTSHETPTDGPFCIMVVCNNSSGVTAAIDRSSVSGDWRIWYRDTPSSEWEHWSGSRRLVHSVRAVPTTKTDPDPAPIRRVTLEIDNGSRPVRVGAFIKPTPGGSP